MAQDLERSFLVAYRGEHVLLRRVALGYEVPSVTHAPFETVQDLKKRLASLFGPCGECVCLRQPHKVFVGRERIYARLVTGDFFGYFSDDYRAIKPNKLPESLNAYHMSLVSDVEKWRHAKAIEQVQLEASLQKALDLRIRHDLY